MIKITNWKRFFAFLIGLIVLLSLFLFFRPWQNTTIKRSGEFVIADGVPAGTVWSNLVSQNFSAHIFPWRYLAWKMSAASQLKSGTYHLNVGESAADVIHRFISGDVIPDELSLVFPEGFTLDQIAARAAAKGIGTAADFKAAAKPNAYTDRFSFLTDIPAGRDLEGYLFPDTYQVFADDDPDALITRMLANFNTKLSDELRADIAASGRSLDQIVIMASIVEREVQTDDDMATVAGILWKRFDEGMGLDVDATVRYVLDKWDGALTVTDLATDSLYNTRKYAGLPPGPISNPGLRALTAAIRPESSNYYYYLSAPDGTTYFARTNDEHNQNKAQYLK